MYRPLQLPSWRGERGVVCTRGLSAGGRGVYTLLWTEWLTDRCKNITLPQTSFVGGNNRLIFWIVSEPGYNNPVYLQTSFYVAKVQSLPVLKYNGIAVWLHVTILAMSVITIIIKAVLFIVIRITERKGVRHPFCLLFTSSPLAQCSTLTAVIADRLWLLTRLIQKVNHPISFALCGTDTSTQFY